MFTKKITTVFFALAVHATAFTTPTERHILAHSFDAIMKDSEDNVQEAASDLLTIAANENEDTFFGYHAISYKSRLFQDILRALFEEHSSVDLPEDFYFLRTPLNGKWRWRNGKESFLKKFDTTMTDEHKHLATADLLICCNDTFKINLSVNDFDEKELSVFYNFFETGVANLRIEEFNRAAKKYPIAEQLMMAAPSIDEAFANVVELVATKVKDLYPQLDATRVKAWLTDFMEDDFFFDYGLTLFHSNLPDGGRSYNNIYRRLVTPYNDTDKVQQSILISLNTSVFGNFMTSGCYSAEIFCNNESILDGDKKLARQLSTWFEKIGLDPNAVPLMWEEGEKILLNSGVARGCLLQLFDNSVTKGKKAFDFLDKNAYVSLKRGMPVFMLEPSALVSGNFFQSESRDFELRLVANNKTVLNPLSVLRMVRHDDLSAEAAREIIDNMKMHLKQAVVDSLKLKRYMRRVERVWKRAAEDKKSDDFKKGKKGMKGKKGKKYQQNEKQFS